MRKIVCGLVGLSLLIAGCARITVPVHGKLSDGTVASGAATASINGDGDFYVDVAGLRCSGKYDAMDMKRSITVPVTCPDGRTGVADVRRSPDGMSGTARIALADGTTGQFVFGRYKYAEAFGSDAPPAPAQVAPAAAQAR